MLKLLNMNEKKNKIRADGGEKMKKQQAILFDLDGTLLNTLDDLTSSVNVTLQAHGPYMTRAAAP